MTERKQLAEAMSFQVWRKSDHPQMQVDALWAEVVALRVGRRQQIRKESRIKRFLHALVLDLWIAATHEDNPWRSISRDKGDYRKESRYRKIFLKFDLFIPLIDDLIALGYLIQKKGNQQMGYQSRARSMTKCNTLLRCCDGNELRTAEC